MKYFLSKKILIKIWKTLSFKMKPKLRKWKKRRYAAKFRKFKKCLMPNRTWLHWMYKIPPHLEISLKKNVIILISKPQYFKHLPNKNLLNLGYHAY